MLGPGRKVMIMNSFLVQRKVKPTIVVAVGSTGGCPPFTAPPGKPWTPLWPRDWSVEVGDGRRYLTRMLRQEVEQYIPQDLRAMGHISQSEFPAVSSHRKTRQGRLSHVQHAYLAVILRIARPNGSHSLAGSYTSPAIAVDEDFLCRTSRVEHVISSSVGKSVEVVVVNTIGKCQGSYCRVLRQLNITFETQNCTKKNMYCSRLPPLKG